MQQDWKNALFNTLSAQEQTEVKERQEAAQAALPRFGRQLFRVDLDKRQKGKVATLITGFSGDDEHLKELASMLKKKCGTGGSVRDGEILIQGDCRTKVAEMLLKEGYKVKTIM